jgi:hypothetical protein
MWHAATMDMNTFIAALVVDEALVTRPRGVTLWAVRTTSQERAKKLLGELIAGAIPAVIELRSLDDYGANFLKMQDERVKAL